METSTPLEASAQSTAISGHRTHEIGETVTALEIEPKFLVKPEAVDVISEITAGVPRERITQYYIKDKVNGNFRIRESIELDPETGIPLRDDQGEPKVIYTQTRKEDVAGENGMVKRETEKRLSKDEFDTLKAAAEKGDGKHLRIQGSIQKIRYHIPYSIYDAAKDQTHELDIELNVFGGNNNPNLDGHMLVEIEFAEQAFAERFRTTPEWIPDWFGREVTDEVTNKQLATGKKTLQDLMQAPPAAPQPPQEQVA